MPKSKNKMSKKYQKNNNKKNMYYSLPELIFDNQANEKQLHQSYSTNTLSF